MGKLGKHVKLNGFVFYQDGLETYRTKMGYYSYDPYRCQVLAQTSIILTLCLLNKGLGD